MGSPSFTLAVPASITWLAGVELLFPLRRAHAWPARCHRPPLSSSVDPAAAPPSAPPAAWALSASRRWRRSCDTTRGDPLRCESTLLCALCSSGSCVCMIAPALRVPACLAAPPASLPRSLALCSSMAPRTVGTAAELGLQSWRQFVDNITLCPYAYSMPLQLQDGPHRQRRRQAGTQGLRSAGKAAVGAARAPAVTGRAMHCNGCCWAAATLARGGSVVLGRLCSSGSGL